MSNATPEENSYLARAYSGEPDADLIPDLEEYLEFNDEQALTEIETIVPGTNEGQKKDLLHLLYRLRAKAGYVNTINRQFKKMSCNASDLTFLRRIANTLEEQLVTPRPGKSKKRDRHQKNDDDDDDDSDHFSFATVESVESEADHGVTVLRVETSYGSNEDLVQLAEHETPKKKRKTLTRSRQNDSEKTIKTIKPIEQSSSSSSSKTDAHLALQRKIDYLLTRSRDSETHAKIARFKHMPSSTKIIHMEAEKVAHVIESFMDFLKPTEANLGLDNDDAIFYPDKMEVFCRMTGLDFYNYIMLMYQWHYVLHDDQEGTGSVGHPVQVICESYITAFAKIAYWPILLFIGYDLPTTLELADELTDLLNTVIKESEDSFDPRAVRGLSQVRTFNFDSKRKGFITQKKKQLLMLKNQTANYRADIEPDQFNEWIFESFDIESHPDIVLTRSMQIVD